MPLLQVIILALVQGITEFLPISSSAHLALAPWLLGWKDQGLTFDIALHLGTLVAVLLPSETDGAFEVLSMPMLSASLVRRMSLCTLRARASKLESGLDSKLRARFRLCPPEVRPRLGS